MNIKSSPELAEFELELGKSTKIITAIAFAILIVFGLYCLSCGFRETILFLALTFFVFILFLLTPIKVEVMPGKIVVKRVLGKVEIPLKRELKVELVDSGRLLFGSAGIFGWFGVFDINGENVFVYSRKNEDLVLVRCGRSYAFGVKDVEGFIKALRLKRLS